MSIDNLFVMNNTEKKDIIVQCCVCKDFKNKEEKYITLNDDLLLKAYSMYLVSHGYCQPCFDDVYKPLLEKYNEKPKRI